MISPKGEFRQRKLKKRDVRFRFDKDIWRRHTRREPDFMHKIQLGLATVPLFSSLDIQRRKYIQVSLKGLPQRSSIQSGFPLIPSGNTFTLPATNTTPPQGGESPD